MVEALNDVVEREIDLFIISRGKIKVLHGSFLHGIYTLFPYER